MMVVTMGIEILRRFYGIATSINQVIHYFLFKYSEVQYYSSKGVNIWCYHLISKLSCGGSYN